MKKCHILQPLWCLKVSFQLWFLSQHLKPRNINKVAVFCFFLSLYIFIPSHWIWLKVCKWPSAAPKETHQLIKKGSRVRTRRELRRITIRLFQIRQQTQQPDWAEGCRLYWQDWARVAILLLCHCTKQLYVVSKYRASKEFITFT